MTRAPYVTLKSGKERDRTPPAVADTTVGWRFVNPAMPATWTISLGETAERVAEQYGIGRVEQDTFAVESQRRAQAALGSRMFEDEIVPVVVPGSGATSVVRDEAPRAGVTLESLAHLKPAFTRGGTVTAGTSSGINDGAAALAVASARTVAELGWTPLARIVSSAVAGVDPSVRDSPRAISI